MQWIAPSEKDTGTETLENRLWAAADELRANSGLTSAQYSQPVLGLIFLRFAEVRFLVRRAALEKQAAGGRRGSRVDDPTAYQAEGILYLTPPARFDHIVRLPEGSDVGKAVNEAMRDIEAKNPQLAGVPAQDVPNLRQHAPAEPAQEGVGDPRDRRGRHVRANL